MPYKNPELNKTAKQNHYQANKALFINRNTERKDSIRQWLSDYKLGKSCEVCGESHPACLDFHHRNPEEKDFKIADAVRRKMSICNIAKEIAKCQILCANCHRKLHYED